MYRLWIVSSHRVKSEYDGVVPQMLRLCFAFVSSHVNSLRVFGRFVGSGISFVVCVLNSCRVDRLECNETGPSFVAGFPCMKLMRLDFPSVSD